MQNIDLYSGMAMASPEYVDIFYYPFKVISSIIIVNIFDAILDYSYKKTTKKSNVFF